MMLCPKDLDQNTLITALIRQISADPTNKGKKTIRITQRKSSPGGMSTIYISKYRISSDSFRGNYTREKTINFFLLIIHN